MKGLNALMQKQQQQQKTRFDRMTAIVKLVPWLGALTYIYMFYKCVMYVIMNSRKTKQNKKYGPESLTVPNSLFLKSAAAWPGNQHNYTQSWGH